MGKTHSITAMRTPFAFDRDAPGVRKQQCPPWCEREPGHGDGEGCLAHVAAAYELADRVELCVIQVISTDPADVAHSPSRPAEFYFWSAEQLTLDLHETSQLAVALRRAGDVLEGIVAAREAEGVTP
jgi:hypothetical protein